MSKLSEVTKDPPAPAGYLRIEDGTMWRHPEGRDPEFLWRMHQAWSGQVFGKPKPRTVTVSAEDFYALKEMAYLYNQLALRPEFRRKPVMIRRALQT